MVPLRHTSDFRVVGPFAAPAGAALEDEWPLFAAGPDYACTHGGPITRAFVEALPPAWLADAIIDSALGWLTPGIALGEPAASVRGGGGRAAPCFFHEPFPGVTSGVRGAANRNRSARHRLCILGLDCTPEVAAGVLDFADAAAAEAFWHPVGDFTGRDAELERRIATGALTRRLVPPGHVVEFGWGTLLRARPAVHAGFQLLLRATTGDPRPRVDARRNVAHL